MAVFFAALYVCYLLCVAEHRLHRLIRNKKWTEARVIVETTEAIKVLCVPVRAAQLVNRMGSDGRTPLQLALEWGDKNDHSISGTVQSPAFAPSDSSGNGTSISTDQTNPLTLGSQPIVDATIIINPCMRSNTVTNVEVREWRELVDTMLGLQPHRGESESTERSICKCSLSKEKLMTQLTLHLFFWFSLGILWATSFSMTHIGAVIDVIVNKDGNSQPGLQECDYWCIVGLVSTIPVSLVFNLPAYFLFRRFAQWVFQLFDVAKRTSDGTSAVAIVGIVWTFFLTFVFCIYDGALFEYCGMMGALLGIFVGLVTALVGGGWFVERYIVPETDPYAKSLKQMLQQNKHSVEVLWPLVRKCIVSTGPGIWEFILPKQSEAHAKTCAIAIVSALAENERTIEDSARVLRTLLEAHIAGIVDPKVCAACIARVISFNPNARLYRGKEKNTPAEMARMLSDKATDVRRAILLVLFDRFAIISVDERIYESATCRVYEAEDLESGDSGDIVAIKLFAGREHYTKEINMRNSLNFDVAGGIADSVVKDLQRYDHLDAMSDCNRVVAAWKRDIITELFGNCGRPGEITHGFGSGAIVMPLAEYDLNARLSLSRIAGIDAKACRSIIRPIVSALSHLHGLGIVHADVKPRNIVYVNETWKLIDLDAAQKIGDIIETSAAGFKWTSGFASPELARCCEADASMRLHRWASLSASGIHADPKMDVFSLGLLLFELLTGQSLFPQDTCNNSMTDSRCVCAPLSVCLPYPTW